MNVKELAVMMNISRATFNRKFKRAFELPAGEWLNLKRKSNVLIMQYSLPLLLAG